MSIFEWRLGNLIDDEEVYISLIIQNGEYAHPFLIKEEIVDDVEIVENAVGVI